MQALDAITIKHLAAELNDLITGAKVSKVQHPHADEFLISLWGGRQAAPSSKHGQTGSDRENHNLLYINVNPQFPFCTLLNTQQKSAAIMTTLHKPTSICMLLRKHLNNARVVDVTALANERIINIRFENFSELGNRVLLMLSIELMGKHSNMIFYDDVQQSILGVAHSVSEKMSQHRELTAGLPYAPPPRPEGKRPLSSYGREDFVLMLGQRAPEEWPDTLNQRIEGLGKLLVSDAVAQSNSPEGLFQRLQRLEAGEDLMPSLSADGKRFSLLDIGNPRPSVLAATREYYLSQLLEKRLGSFREKLANGIRAQQKKLGKQMEALEPVSEGEIEQLQSIGNLILNAHASGQMPPQPRGGVAMIPDLVTGLEHKVEVDPHIGWPENAQLYYKRAKKAQARQKACTEMREQLENKQRYYNELQSMVAHADALNELVTLAEELISEGLMKPDTTLGGKREKSKMAGVATFSASTGLTLHVGKSGVGNATIIGRLAKPDDYWLHVQEMPGSHVLVKNEGKKTLDNQTLLEASNLAVYYSSARDSKNVPVIYTQAKHVRKIPDSWPGHVTYKNEQAVFITADADLIRQLSESQRATKEEDEA